MDRITSDRLYTGQVKFLQPVSMPAGTITDNNIVAGAGIAASKLVHRHALTYSQGGGEIVNESRTIHICRAACEIVSVAVRPETAPEGGDLQYTVDVQYATDAGAWASLLDALITISSADSDNTVQDATLGVVTAFAANTAFRVVIAVDGDTGNQGQGVAVTVNLDEEPD